MGAIRRFLDVPFRSQTYRNLAYLVLAFPLGLAYFVGVTTGLSLGVGMVITLVGIPLLVLTLAGATLVAGFEAALARWLLRMDVDAPSGLTHLDEETVLTDLEGLGSSLRRFLTTPTTWTSLVLVLLKFVFGLVAFVALTIYVALVGSMVTAPVFYDVPAITYHVGPYVVDTAAEGFGIAALGVVTLVVGLHVLNGLARLFGLATATLLGQADNALYTP